MKAHKFPDSKGHFGKFGGKYVIETLMPALQELETLYEQVQKDPKFKEDLNYYLKHYVGRPTSLYFAERLTNHLGGAKIYLKREDLTHTAVSYTHLTLPTILLV